MLSPMHINWKRLIPQSTLINHLVPKNNQFTKLQNTLKHFEEKTKQNKILWMFPMPLLRQGALLDILAR